MLLSDYRPAQRIVELTVGYAVADIEELAIRIERWQAGRPQEDVRQLSAPGRRRTRG
jgi:hypothetical protein